MRAIATALDWPDVLALLSLVSIVVAAAAFDWRLGLLVGGIAGLVVAFAVARASATTTQTSATPSSPPVLVRRTGTGGPSAE